MALRAIAPPPFVKNLVCMLFAENHFVESTFFPTEGASKVRVRAK